MSSRSFVRALKDRIPERVKGPILAYLQSASDPQLDALRRRKKVVIALAGFYQNLGDLAIAYAQKRFIEQALPDYEVVLFPSHDSYGRMKALKSVCSPSDIITTVGGGNMDDVYSSLEDCRRFIVRSFPNNPIISFPQTFDFSNTDKGRKALKRSAKTYGRHKNLTIFAREPESARRMKDAFSSNSVELVPDIVLSLKLDNPPTERDGVFICIRKDKEAKLSPEQRAEITQAISASHANVTVGDTVDVALEDCSPERYEAALESFWDMLRHQEVVVTDRLHGMIFCAITKTPCVVLANSNHKIEGVYRKWLADAAHITFLESFDLEPLQEAVHDLKLVDLSLAQVPDFASEFGPLKNAVLHAAEK